MKSQRTTLTSKTRMSPDSSPSVHPTPVDCAIIVDSLVKFYTKSSKPALDDFSLVVEKGDFFGLLGPNGAGKTTALSIISGFMRSDKGTVTVLGKRIYGSLKKLKGAIGLVPQDLALYENLTAKENLLFFGRFYGLFGKKLQMAIDRCLDFTELQDQAERRVNTFSGGMKRRLNLSAGLLHQPQILFLDEPTVGIDAQSRNLIHQRLAELNAQGTTLIYTTHYMEEAEELCSKIGIIDEGRLLVQGVTTQLPQKLGYKNLSDLFFSLTGKQLRDE